MALHRDIVNVQVEMLRQFQIQQVSDNLYCIHLVIALWVTLTSVINFQHVHLGN